MFLGAPINGALGVLIAVRRPRNAIGWFLLAIAAAGAVFLFTNFLAIRGLLSGAAPDGWVAWPGNVFNNASPVAEYLIFLLILFFPDGRLLPGPRWRWVAGVALAAVAVELVQALTSTSLNQLSPRVPSVPNPLAVPALDALTNSNSLLPQLSFFLLILLVLSAVVVRFRRSRDLERRQMRGFAYVAGATLAAVLLTFTFTPPNHQLATASVFVLLGTFLAVALARVRRGRSAQRRPIRWTPYIVATVVGLGSVSYSFTSPSNGPDVANAALGIGFGVLLPATIGLAVVRHGLYDLDLFISRTLVYGSLGGVHHGGVRGHRGGDRDAGGEWRQAQPRAVDPRHGDRGDRLPAGAGAGAEGGQPAGVRTAGDAVRGAQRVLGTGGGDVRGGRGAAPHGPGAPGGNRRGVGDGVAARQRGASPRGDVSGGR